MRINKIIILINELEEDHFRKMPELDRPEITFRELLSLNKNEMLTITQEDIFIGSRAKWSEISDRIEEYQQLALLRNGELEIVYYSIYDVLIRLYTNDADKYFHFFDTCVEKIEIAKLVNSFPPSFKCSFVNRSNENINMLTNKKVELDQLGFLPFSRFLSSGNYFQNIQIA